MVFLKFFCRVEFYRHISVKNETYRFCLFVVFPFDRVFMSSIMYIHRMKLFYLLIFSIRYCISIPLYRYY